MKASIRVLFTGFLAFLAGCGGGNSLKLTPVAGVVTSNDSPVADASLVFYPEKGPPGVARTDKNGAFRVETNGRPGATVGNNKITVTVKQSNAIPPSDGRAIEFKNESSQLKKYASEQDTPLVVEIPAAGYSDLKLDLVE